MRLLQAATTTRFRSVSRMRISQDAPASRGNRQNSQLSHATTPGYLCGLREQGWQIEHLADRPAARTGKNTDAGGFAADIALGGQIIGGEERPFARVTDSVFRRSLSRRITSPAAPLASMIVSRSPWATKMHRRQTRQGAWFAAA